MFMPELNQESNQIQIDLYRIIGELTVQIKGLQMVNEELNKQLVELKKPADETKK